jgi:hypothetical protein
MKSTNSVKTIAMHKYKQRIGMTHSMRTRGKWRMLLKKELSNWLSNIRLSWKRRGMSTPRRCLKMQLHSKSCKLRRKKTIASLRRLCLTLGMNTTRTLGR